VLRLIIDLGHPYGIVRSVKTVESSSISIELIAKNDNEVAW
jgi:hypothetical protein